LVPRSMEDIDWATGMLVFYALESEVARARSKPDAALDVRDLTFRAFVDWGHKRMAGEGKNAYLQAARLLNRALALAPDDPLALKITTKINLCDCVEAWSSNVVEQQAIGERALDRFLGTHPDDEGMLHEKAGLYAVRGRYSEALVILDKLLAQHPENTGAMEDKAVALLKLGRPNEAAAPAAAAYAAHDLASRAALLAAIDYELTDYPSAERLAQKAIIALNRIQLGNSLDGTVRLTLIAAAARLRQDATVRAALSDLSEAVPELRSISAIRKWMNPQSYLYGYEPLFEGLRLAGLHD
jgi:tetratricopeptide (TPR) repeat protein